MCGSKDCGVAKVVVVSPTEGGNGTPAPKRKCITFGTGKFNIGCCAYSKLRKRHIIISHGDLT